MHFWKRMFHSIENSLNKKSWTFLRSFLSILSFLFSLIMNRVIVELSWIRARAFNPKIGQNWTHSFCSKELNEFEFLFEKIDRIRILVRRVESNRHTCSSSTQFESRLIQKSRIEWSFLELNDQVCSTNWIEQAILFEFELWASSNVLILELNFEFCSSSWVGLKKSVRTQFDDHTNYENDVIILAMNASLENWKKILMILRNEKKHSVRYENEIWSKTKKKYDVIKKKCREIFKILKKIHFYFYDVKFILKINARVLVDQLNRFDTNLFDALVTR
jgi:hypothetical protein